MFPYFSCNIKLFSALQPDASMSLQIETAQNVGVDYEVASIGDRILAQLIDYAVYFVWMLAMFSFAVMANGFNSGTSGEWLIISGIFLPIAFYPLLCEYFLNGQTVGKLARKIRVIKLDGSKATLGAFVLRWLLSVVDVSIFSGVVAVITIAINGKGQRLGDIAAGTTVIKLQPSVRFEQLMPVSTQPDYAPVYPQVVRLTDKDISTLRKVIASGNESLQEAATAKIESIMGINNLEVPVDFLQTVVSDYEYYTTREE